LFRGLTESYGDGDDRRQMELLQFVSLFYQKAPNGLDNDDNVHGTHSINIISTAEMEAIQV
jgi:hypothetical protein